MSYLQVTFHVRQVAKEIVAAEAAVHLGVCVHLLHHRWVGVLQILTALVVTRVVDLQVPDGVGRVVTVFTHEPLHNVVCLHVTFQVALL